MFAYKVVKYFVIFVIGCQVSISEHWVKVLVCQITASRLRHVVSLLFVVLSLAQWVTVISLMAATITNACVCCIAVLKSTKLLVFWNLQGCHGLHRIGCWWA